MTKLKLLTWGYEVELNSIMKKHQFHGDIPAFRRFMLYDTSFCVFRTSDEIGDRFKRIQQTVDAAAPQYFKLIPKTKMEILVATGASRGNGRYISGLPDGSRPGVRGMVPCGNRPAKGRRRRLHPG